MKVFSLNPRLVLAAGLLAFSLLFSPETLHAQDEVEVAMEETEQQEAESQSVIEIILHGGPLIITVWIALLVTSITMVTFVIQNILQLRISKMAPPALVDSLRQTLDSGNYQEAWEICRANKNYLANVVQAGLERLGRGKNAFYDAMAEHGLKEAQVLRTRNSYLSVIGVISPMLGLLGTVIGMMGAFATLGTHGLTDPRGLATAIGEVLLATATGIFLAIPAFVAYYFFRNRAQMIIVHAEDTINRLVEDIPFDELQGVHIGEDFDPGAMPAAAEAKTSRKVSKSLTTNCPVCNGSIEPGQNPCPHCGATLEWAE